MRIVIYYINYTGIFCFYGDKLPSEVSSKLSIYITFTSTKSNLIPRKWTYLYLNNKGIILIRGIRIFLGKGEGVYLNLVKIELLIQKEKYIHRHLRVDS